MPRVARIKNKSQIYHIMIRSINQQNIFSTDKDHEKFIAILAKYQRSRVVGIFPNQESYLRYICLRLMEIDEEGQTGRRYMKINKEDQFSQEDDPLLEEIKQMKERVNTLEVLVAI